jgi:hypothetical protein
MAFHNTNWTAVPMPVGTYTISDLGNGISASTVHQIFCTTTGTVTISAMGGGTFTWAATAGQKIDVVCANVVVASGAFVGFKAAFQPNYVQSLRG